jgi:hypothetical protein
MMGNPIVPFDDKTWTKAHPWNLRPIIRFGGGDEADGNGASVTIPQGYDTVWVRVLGERWNAIHAYFLDAPNTDLGIWVGGFRGSNYFNPDGSIGDGTGNTGAHQWMPIPAGRAGTLALISKKQTNEDFWVSGIGFSKNPWAHAVQSSIGYNWASNGGDAVTYNNNNWGYDVLCYLPQLSKLLLKVPVVPSGRDKLLYIIGYNENTNQPLAHSGITVGGTAIERFLATYDNPFARHWNGRAYQRYAAARIPANLINTSARFLDVRIDMSYQNAGIYFREIGTHDLDVPWQ